TVTFDVAANASGGPRDIVLTNPDGQSVTVSGGLIVDNAAPVLQSFLRQTPSGSPTNADTLVFRATFSEAVNNVDAADFSVTGTTAAVSAVALVSAGVYDVTVSGGDLAGLNGTVGLDLAAGQNITDAEGNALPAGEPATDQTFVIDNTAPALTSFT